MRRPKDIVCRSPELVPHLCDIRKIYPKGKTHDSYGINRDRDIIF